MDANERKAVEQKLLEISVKHILKQGKPSGKLDEATNFICLYKAPDGSSCAAAPFIKHYYPKMENKDFSHLARAACWEGALDEEAAANSRFVVRLQSAHDVIATCGESFISSYKERIRLLFDDYDLSFMDLPIEEL